MKGIVFTAFLDMVEQDFGDLVVETIIDRSELPHGGAYTAVGSYPAAEMVRLVTALSQESRLPVPALLEAFGRSLFGGLHRSYPHFFGGGDLFDFLASIHTYIHVEVKKLYRDAELPSLVVEQRTPDRLALRYASPRCMGDLARGLLKASIAHFGNPDVALAEERLTPDGSQVRFVLSRAMPVV